MAVVGTTRRTPRVIRRMVDRIVERFHPEKVILFGSHARGEAGPDSDVDLLVVMPVRGSVRRKCIQVRVALRGFSVSKDVIIVRPRDWEARKDIAGTIEYPASHEGKVLYGRG